MQPKQKFSDTRRSKARLTRSTRVGVVILKTVRFSSDPASIGRKPGLNRCEHRLCSRRAFQWLQPDEMKVSRPVLRGGSGSNATPFTRLHGLRRPRHPASRPFQSPNPRSSRHLVTSVWTGSAAFRCAPLPPAPPVQTEAQNYAYSGEAIRPESPSSCEKPICADAAKCSHRQWQ